MHLKTNNFIYLLLFLVPTSVWANKPELVNRLHEAYSDVNYFEASFVQQKNVKFLSKPLISKGLIKYSNTAGMIWEIIEPIWVKTKITEEGIFKTNQYKKNQKVTDVQMKAVAQILSGILSSKLDRIESQFKISAVELDKQNNNWTVNLTAVSVIIKKAIHGLVIKGNLANENQKKGITEIIIIDSAENQTLIQFLNVRLSNEPMSQDVIDAFQ